MNIFLRGLRALLRNGKVGNSESCCEAVCCGGVARPPEEAGDCCKGTWFPAPEGEAAPDKTAVPFVPFVWQSAECPAGKVYARWGQFGQCCGCIPDEIFDKRVGEYVPTANIVADLCCDTCSWPLPFYLPYNEYGAFVGCFGRCCADDECSLLRQADCASYVHPTKPAAARYAWHPDPCCVEGACNIECCGVETATFPVIGPVCPGNQWALAVGEASYVYTATATNAKPSDVAVGLAAVVSSPFTAVAKAASIVVTGVDAGGGTITQPGGQPQPPTSVVTAKIPPTECAAQGGDEKVGGVCPCNPGEVCCERALSNGVSLTFTKPAAFSGSVRVTVTGTVGSPILIHGVPVAAGAINHTFTLCYGTFNIEPTTCGSSLDNLNVKVCYEEETETAESLDFSGCNGLTIALSHCAVGCATTMTYDGPGHTSNSTIQVWGDATIEANGTGPLVLTGNITPVASCVETLTLTGTSTAANEIAGVIGNSASDLSVRKTGTGTWWLSGFNTYEDGLVVLDGTLVIAAPSNGTQSPFGGNNKMAVVGDAAATSGTAALLLAAGITISQSIIVPSGSGQKVVFGGLGSGSFTGAGTITLGRNVTFQAATGSTVIFANGLAVSGGAVSLTVGSAGNDGTVRLASFPAGVPVSVIGSIAVVAGTLQTGATGQLAAAIPVTLGSSTASATFDLQGFTQRQSNLSFTGTGSSVIASTGTLRLFNNAGTLTALVNVLDGTGHEISSKVAIDHNSVLDVAASAKLVISGVISNGTTAARTLTKDGDGTLEFTAANTYTGTTTINAGTLKAGSLTAFGTGGIVVNAGGTLDKNGFAIANTITNNGGTVLN